MKKHKEKAKKRKSEIKQMKKDLQSRLRATSFESSSDYSSSVFPITKKE